MCLHPVTHTHTGEPGSIVRGHIIDGVFDGIIRSKQGTFYVEQAHKFFKDRSRDFHSIIYHSDDVRVPEGVASCGGAKGKLMEKLNDLASSAVPLHDDKRTLYGEDRYLRLKRQTIGNNRFCPIRVAADHLYLAEVGGGSVVNSMTQIASVIANVQDIYSTTDFDGVVGPDGIQPVIVRLEILDQNMRGYQYGANNIPVDSFLDLWSQEDQSEYCLALLLTHRDFADGVLGLAWVAQPAGGNSGGICENRVRLRTGERSLNTGIVTYLNFGRTQPQSVATITIAHEFGHNFGSPVSHLQLTALPIPPPPRLILPISLYLPLPPSSMILVALAPPEGPREISSCSPKPQMEHCPIMTSSPVVVGIISEQCCRPNLTVSLVRRWGGGGGGGGGSWVHGVGEEWSGVGDRGTGWGWRGVWWGW